MSAIAKLREQIAIARDAGHFVVLTPDEAQAVIDEHRRRLNEAIRDGEKEARDCARDAAAEAHWRHSQGDDYGSY